MKKVLFVLLLSLSFSVNAHEGWRHGGGHYVYRDGMGWVVPAVIGGLIVYGATQPRTVVVQQPVPVYTPPPPPQYQAPYGYHWEAILDGNCGCYRSVLIPN